MCGGSYPQVQVTCAALFIWTRRVHRPFRGVQSPESQVQGQMCCGPHPQVQRLCAEGLIPNSRSNVLPYSLGLLGLTDSLEGVPVPKFKVTCAVYLIPKFKAKCAALFIRKKGAKVKCAAGLIPKFKVKCAFLSISKRVQRSNVLRVSYPSSRSYVLRISSPCSRPNVLRVSSPSSMSNALPFSLVKECKGQMC